MSKTYEEKKEEKRRKRHKTKHHILAQSRFPPEATQEEKDKDNIVFLPQGFHECWHYLFRNMTSEEIIFFVMVIMTPELNWTLKELNSLIDDIVKDT